MKSLSVVKDQDLAFIVGGFDILVGKLDNIRNEHVIDPPGVEGKDAPTDRNQRFLDD